MRIERDTRPFRTRRRQACDEPAPIRGSGSVPGAWSVFASWGRLPAHATPGTDLARGAPAARVRGWRRGGPERQTEGPGDYRLRPPRSGDLHAADRRGPDGAPGRQGRV